MSHVVERGAVPVALPPGPSESTPGQVAWFDQDPFGRLRELARTYGPIFTLRLGSYGFGTTGDTGVPHNGNWVFLTRPHQVRIMHEADHDTADAAAANIVFFGAVDDGSVGYITGKAHRLRRSQLLPAFSSRRDYATVITDVARRAVRRWPRGKTFELFGELQTMTSEVIVAIVCANLDRAGQSRLVELLPRTEDARLPFEEVDAAVAGIREVVGDALPGYLERAAASGNHDVLAQLLTSARDDRSLTDSVLVDEVFSLLYTGFSTTANSLSWAFVRLMSEPEARRRLIAEVGDRFSGERPYSREDFVGLDYVEATVKETLRLHPVSALNGVRMVTRELRVDDYLMPPGTFLVQCAYLLQRSSDLYQDPEAFHPDRFLHRTVDPANWAPFGGGDRICIGRGFASEEMKMVLATVVPQVSMELDGDFPAARRQGLFMAPANRVPCRIRA